MAPRETIVATVKNRLPSFVKEKYPVFAQFIDDYYTWQENDGNFQRLLNDWKTNMETSNAVEPFVDAILKDAGFDLALEDDGNRLKRKTNLLLLLREFYLARGSKQSYDFLFKLLFGSEAIIEYPREMLLVPSSATYGQTFKVFVSATSNETIQGKRTLDTILKNSTTEYGYVSGVVSKSLATIEKITRILSDGKVFLEIDVLKPTSAFTVGESVRVQVGDDHLFETIQTVVSLDVNGGGNNFSVGDLVVVDGCSIVGAASVEAIDSGSVVHVNIATAGTQYAIGDLITATNWGGSTGSGFSARVSQVGVDGSIQAIEIISGGYNYDRVPHLTVRSENGTGAALLAVAPRAGAIKLLRYSAPYARPTGPLSISFVSEFGFGATITAVNATVFNRSAWEDHVGFLGERCHLIDSDKFQQFSYEIITQVDPSRYISAVADLLHPVGYVRTSIIDIQAHVNLALSLDTEQ